jgi:hypothetical protein
MKQSDGQFSLPRKTFKILFAMGIYFVIKEINCSLWGVQLRECHDYAPAEKFFLKNFSDLLETRALFISTHLGS